MPAKKKDASAKEKKAGGALTIDWHVPDGTMTPFATNMLIQTIENEFKISFFEIKPPIRLDASQPFTDTVRADCVASIIVTADRLPKFIDALQIQLGNYKSKKEMIKK